MKPGDIVINPNFSEGAKGEYFQKYCLIEEILPHKQRKGGLAARLVGIHSREFLTHASLEVLAQHQINQIAMNQEQEVSPVFVTKKEIAATCKVTIVTVSAWMKSGKIPYLKIGRRVLFDKQKVMNHLVEKYEVNKQSNLDG